MAAQGVLRTAEARFEGLEDFAFQPRYLNLSDARWGTLRMAAIASWSDGSAVATRPTSSKHTPSVSGMNERME